MEPRDPLQGAPENDDLSSLIDGVTELPPGSFDVPLPPHGFREAVFARTVRVVRARSRARWLSFAAALLVAYAAGLLTTSLVKVKNAEPPAPVPVGAPPGAPPRAGASVASAVDPAEILRGVSIAPLADRIRLLKQAGDAYLLGRGDLDGALHCYRQLLELAPTDVKTKTKPGEDDTWLLAALKQGHSTPRMR
jgi:hypothetical protein